MAKKIRWGVLSTARIGTEKVIPAMQKGKSCSVEAIASRDLRKAKKEARRLGIPKAFGSYEELLADPAIDAVYNPLPNHLHLLWSLKAMEAGKHVLCEKPIGMNAAEAERLATAARAHRELVVMEAFMYRFHPLWDKVRQLVRRGKLGEIRSIHSVFFYYNVNPEDIRNKADIGGGGLLDIGCYCISLPRFILGREPVRVMGTQDVDPVMKTDRLTTGLLDFSGGVTATFACATQLSFLEHALISGTKASLILDLPFTPPPDQPARALLVGGGRTEEIQAGPVDQYTLQGEAFARAILEKSGSPFSPDDAVKNMRVIDGVVRSAGTGGWVSLA